MYAAGAGLVLVLLVMGVSLINSFDRMKSVQDTLNAISGNTDSIEARETSGTVTAVTSGGEAEAGSESSGNEESGGEAAESQDSQNDPASAAGGDIQNSSTDGTDAGQDSAGTADAAGGNTGTAENGSDGIYIVEEGDTLAIISRKIYGDVTHVDAICRMNGLTDGNLIYEGQKLLLP